MRSEELWSVPLCLFLCSFSLSSSFLVEELSSHCHATICSHHFNLLVTDLEKHNPVCSTDLSDTFLCLLHQIYFLPRLVLYVRRSAFLVLIHQLLFEILLFKTQLCHRNFCCVDPSLLLYYSCQNMNPLPSIFKLQKRSSLYNIHLLEVMLSEISVTFCVTNSHLWRALQCA